MARELTGDGLTVECLDCGAAHDRDGAFCTTCERDVRD